MSGFQDPISYDKKLGFYILGETQLTKGCWYMNNKKTYFFYYHLSTI